MQIQPDNAVSLAQQLINKQQNPNSTEQKNQAQEIVERAQQARRHSGAPEALASDALKSLSNPNPSELTPELPTPTHASLSTTTARFEASYERQVEKGRNINIKV